MLSLKIKKYKFRLTHYGFQLIVILDRFLMLWSCSSLITLSNNRSFFIRKNWLILLYGVVLFFVIENVLLYWCLDLS